MILCLSLYRAKKKHEKEFEDLLCTKLKPLQEDAGCVFAGLLKKKEEEHTYLWIDLWKDEKDIEKAHQEKLIAPEHPIWNEISKLFDSFSFIGKFIVAGDGAPKEFRQFLSGLFGKERR